MEPETRGEPAPAPLPECRTSADLERLSGQRVRLLGRYEVAPVPDGKRAQVAAIVLEDGARVLRSYRPVAEELGFVEKRVVVVGTVRRDSGQPATVQQILAPHVAPERIDLAPGETPYPTPPTEVPAPRLVRDRAAFAAAIDRWSQVQGTLRDVKPIPDDSMWSNAFLSLPDGGEVRIEQVSTNRYLPLKGKQVTVVGRPAWRAKQELGLTAGVRVCEGWVADCHKRPGR